MAAVTICSDFAAAKSLQLCPTLFDPIDGSPPGSPIPGILQARTMEWVAISFSNAWKWKVILEPPKIKFLTVSIVSSSIFHEVMEPYDIILVFWMLSFKPAFSHFSFTLINRL